MTATKREPFAFEDARRHDERMVSGDGRLRVVLDPATD
jgi:hypothetical protein